MKRKPAKPKPESKKARKPEGETHMYDWRERAGRQHDGKFSRD